MKRIGSLILAFVLGSVPSAAAGRSRPPDVTRIDASVRRGSACMAGQIDGGRFRDPYLSYVYPDEHLPAPPGASPLTYRRIDGYIVLALLARGGSPPGPLAAHARHAEEALRLAAAAWRGAGFSNTVRDPRAGGVAIDTFCMVGWLFDDAEMAREVALALDGSRWLPDGWYEEPESYRALADESWCVRLLLSGEAAADDARRVLERLASGFRARRERGAGTVGTFYEAWHLGMVLARRTEREAPAAAPLTRDVLGSLRAWAELHEPAVGADVLEWANLASAELLPFAGTEGRTLRQRAIEILVRLQGPDGCWTIAGAEPPESASGFTTLRALLALQLYRADRERGGAGSPRPAP